MPFDGNKFEGKPSTTEYLRQVHRVVTGIQDHEFDIDTWMSECGTVGCALGWSAVDPWFVAHGVTTEEGVPFFNGSYGSYGFAEVSGITEQESYDTFGGDSGNTRQDVLRKLDALILKYEPAEALS